MQSDEVPPTEIPGTETEIPISDHELSSIIWSGEMLDIVLSSLNNLYGKEKAWHSMQYGIYLPITKYIDESLMFANNEFEKLSSNSIHYYSYINIISNLMYYKELLKESALGHTDSRSYLFAIFVNNSL